MARKQKSRKTIPQVAIVGEGITEWHYFDDLKRSKRFPFKIKPSLPKNSHYEQVFNKAIQLRKEGYDRVFCVIDVDTLKTKTHIWQQYSAHRNQLTQDEAIQVIESMPCIEYWFLLHFRHYSTKIYPTYNSLASTLKAFIPHYQKKTDYYKRIRLYQTLTTQGNLAQATSHAIRLRQEKGEQDNPLFPYTDLDLILKELGV